MTLYIAGPMTGLPDYNYPAFERARADLEAAGYEVLCPTDNGAGTEPGSRPWSWYMRAALHQLLQADAVAVLPGWEASKGAALEVHVANSLNMPVRSLAAWLREAEVGV
ncbi:DUF4406 domain-containing protein [Thioalkalivibrio sp.]|uniref:DUF4406 domain-containing protein n=1 Tax=Thioalkalivibrio sp. TaxID=2093813 RepID=UPI003568752C